MTDTLPLFDVMVFHGAELSPDECIRLEGQYERVEKLMSDGRPRTLERGAKEAKCSEASFSARLRQMRTKGWTVERRKIGTGLFSYRATREG